MGHAAVNRFDRGCLRLEEGKMVEFLDHSAVYANIMHDMEKIRKDPNDTEAMDLDHDSSVPSPDVPNSSLASASDTVSTPCPYPATPLPAARSAADSVEEWDYVDHSDDHLFSGSDLAVTVDSETGRMNTIGMRKNSLNPFWRGCVVRRKSQDRNQRMRRLRANMKKWLFLMASLSKQQRHLAKARAQLAEGRATGKENCTPSSLSTRSPPRFSKTALSPHKSKKKHDVADSNYIAELCKENLLLRRREKWHKEQIADLKRKVKMNDKRVNAAVAEVQAATAAARTSAERAICDAVKTQTELADKLARAEQ
ncbi:hypothetical protein B0H10DRAFT_2198116 [Mycena sp. CBHHK59/15]|nr:hypothetical protein B0H10DRAFT_2198116 [Mycena sp. CBHHK59/15]